MQQMWFKTLVCNKFVCSGSLTAIKQVNTHFSGVVGFPGPPGRPGMKRRKCSLSDCFQNKKVRLLFSQNVLV